MTFKSSVGRHGICQKVYTGKVVKDQILPKSAEISMNARLRQHSVNDGKIQKVEFVSGILSFNLIFLCKNPTLKTHE